MSEQANPDAPAPPVAVTRRARVRALVLVAAGSAVTGLLIGALWAWIAPPIRAVVALTRSGERCMTIWATSPSISSSPPP